MPTYTTNYNLAKPLINSAVDQDLWGDELNSDMDIIDSTMKSISDIATALQLPIGSLYMNKTVPTNPAILLGYGTWVAIVDRFIVARGSTYTSTGGAATVTLSINELPAHTHSTGQAAFQAGSLSTNAVWGTGNVNITTTTGSTGSGAAFSIIPVYQAVYMWERTA